MREGGHGIEERAAVSAWIHAKKRRVRRIKSAPYSCDLCRELRWNNKHLGDDGFACECSGV